MIPLAFTPRTSFVADGKTRELRDPDGPASGSQLYRLAALGALALVEPGDDVPPITKADAAGAIAELLEERGRP